MTQKRLYCWVVLACLGSALAACSSEENKALMSWSDIGSPNDMTTAQDQSRANRGIPSATEMPPGLGEDLPMPQQAPPAPPVAKNY